MEKRGKDKQSEGSECYIKVLNKSWKYILKALVYDKVKVDCSLRVA
jgi:hypothetical protein